MLSLKVQRTACLAGTRVVFRGVMKADQGATCSGMTSNAAIRCLASESDGRNSAKTVTTNVAQMQIKTNRMIEGFKSQEHEFSPSRDRETVSAVIEEVHSETPGSEGFHHRSKDDVDKEKTEFEKSSDDHTQKYDMKGSVSLYSVMQSNVPTPYGGSPPHLNMPRGGEQSRQKYLSSNLQGTHPTRKFSTTTTFLSEAQSDKTQKTEANGKAEVLASPVVSDVKLSQKDRLKRAVKEYGATVVVFHVGISLMSLGGFYLAVSSGLDVVGLLTKMGVGQTILESRLATGASTFVVAYAVHKVFAPVRIATTLTATPFIVKYLRRVGFLKPPKSKK